MNRRRNMPAIRRRIPMGAVPGPIGPDTQGEYGAKDYFIYDASLVNGLAPAGTGADSFNIDSDADFLWQKGTYFVNVANDGFLDGTRPIPGVAVTIKDTTSGRDIMSAAVPIPAMFGSGELPFILPVAKLMPKTTTIQVNFANITDNTTYTFIGLYFHGQKLFG